MFRYFGPPGTGKTTRLLNQVDDLLREGMAPNDIGYFAFTRRAAHEARDRAAARFNLDPKKDLLYFRTLHSLAFQVLGMTPADVLNPANLREFGAETGIDLSSSGAENIADDGFVLLKSNDPIMRAIDLARNSLRGEHYAYNAIELEMPYYEFTHIYTEYQRFKEMHGLKDFTDMMVALSKKPERLPFFRVVFLDEAQDLTPLQWTVAHHLGDRADRMFVAGDDDQGIYRWAGADINRFISLPGGSDTLTQSYRIPRKVHMLAETVSSHIRHRQKKHWLPRTAEGSVHKIYDPHTLDFNGAEWLILAQANYMLDELSERLVSTGQYFERRGTASLKADIRGAISSWTHLHEDPAHELSHKEAVNLFNHISSGEKLARGAKKRLSSANEQDLFSLSTLREHFGLRTEAEDWDVVLDRIGDEDRAYATALLNRGVNLFEPPKIKLSTIHGAKGGEADNVLVYLDLSTRALQEMERHPDDAQRVLYVAITRAKENLVLKMPDDAQRGWAL